MQDLYRSVIQFKKYVDTHVVSTDNEGYQRVKQNVLKNLEAPTEPAHHNDPSNAKMQAKLYRIYDVLAGAYSKLRLPANERTDFHSHVYRFFNTACGIQSPAKHFQYFPTRAYDEFVKGITVFGDSQQPIQKPSYHRPGSCGSKALDYMLKFGRLETDTREERKAKLDALKMCIIERKIYDQIYECILHQQNIGHLMEIHNLERLYMDYTSSTIDVNVHFKDEVMPYLVIVTVHKRNAVVSRVSYEKRSNGEVHVETYTTQESARQLHLSSPLAKPSRVQTFEHHSPLPSHTTKPHTV